MAPRKILIVGAGIAGNATAFWLAKLGHVVTVIERHPNLRVNGLQIDLRGHGIEIMKMMGLEEAVRAKCVPEKGMAVIDKNGRQRAFFAANTSGHGAQNLTSEFEIMRGDLCQIIHDAAIKQGAGYRFGTSVSSYTERPSARSNSQDVEVTFTDERRETFDLVVGCDGQGSVIRRLMLNGGSLRSDRTDSALTINHERIAYFTIPSSIQDGQKYVNMAYMMPGKRSLGLRRHRDDRVQVYLTADVRSGSGQLATVKRGDIQAEMEAFADLFSKGGWKTDEAVKALRAGVDDFYCQHSGYVKLDKWSSGHATLVGDAAHGCPPDGTGTSSALLGAYVLAGEISKLCPGDKESSVGPKDDESTYRTAYGLDTALKAYANVLQPYMQKLHGENSGEPGWFDMIPSTAMTVELFNVVMSVVAFLGLDKLMYRCFFSEGVKGWTLPKYPEMFRDCNLDRQQSSMIW